MQANLVSKVGAPTRTLDHSLLYGYMYPTGYRAGRSTATFLDLHGSSCRPVLAFDKMAVLVISQPYDEL